MEYGININFFAKTTGLERAAELVSAAGFTKIDYTPDVIKDNWKRAVNDAMRIFDANGLCVHQTHMPYNRYGKYGDNHNECMKRCAEATEITGARFMVSHGDEFDFDGQPFSPKAALDYNYNLYLPFVKRAEAAGYKVAFETVFEDMSRNRRRFTSQENELMSLIRAFDSESVVCCWDFGHANIAFKDDVPDVINRFKGLIQCTHLHDNTGKDSHQMPMTGDIRWERTIDSLKKAGFDGVLSIEYAHGSIPEPLISDYLKLSRKTAEFLWEKY